jgi:hypothetical protein
LSNPAWYHNLVANPKTKVEVGTETFDVTVRVLTGAERDEYFAKQVAVAPGFWRLSTQDDEGHPGHRTRASVGHPPSATCPIAVAGSSPQRSHLKLHLNSSRRTKSQVSGSQTVHLSQAGLLPGAPKIWATSTSGQLGLEDTCRV